MKEQEVTLFGNIYFGSFSAIPKQKRFWAKNDYISYVGNNYRWEGMGIVEHIKLQKFYSFLLTTPYRFYEQGLENCLINVKGKWSNLQANIKITEPKFVYDLILEQIYKDAKEKENITTIPMVFPKILLCDELVDMKFIKEIGRD